MHAGVEKKKRLKTPARSTFLDLLVDLKIIPIEQGHLGVRDSDSGF